MLTDSREDLRTHRGGQVLVVLLQLVHELQVLLLFLQLSHTLFALLQFLLRPGQLVPQPLVLLTQPAYLSTQLLLLRLHRAQVARQRHHHLDKEPGFLYVPKMLHSSKIQITSQSVIGVNV